MGPRRAASYQTCAAPSASSRLGKGSNTWMTSTSPALSAATLPAMVWSATRAMRAGSMPARRRSCCRQSHGVGTSLTVASRTDLRSASVKSGRGGAAHQQERIARHDLGEADDVAARHLLIGLHDPHRPAPADVDRAVHQAQRGSCGRGELVKRISTPSAAKASTRERDVERRIEQRAQGFLKDDGHGRKTLGRDVDNMRGGLPSRQGVRSGCPPRQPSVRRTDFRDRPIPAGDPLGAGRVRIQHSGLPCGPTPLPVVTRKPRALSRSTPARYRISAAR